MPYYGVHDTVQISIEGRIVEAILVDIDLRNRRFKAQVKGTQSEYWVDQSQFLQDPE
jgi:hypothetical protein